MEAIEMFEMAKSVGAEFKVIDNHLKGRNLKALDNETRQWIRDHKDEVVRLLSSRSDFDSVGVSAMKILRILTISTESHRN